MEPFSPFHTRCQKLHWNESHKEDCKVWRLPENPRIDLHDATYYGERKMVKMTAEETKKWIGRMEQRDGVAPNVDSNCSNYETIPWGRGAQWCFRNIPYATNVASAPVTGEVVLVQSQGSEMTGTELKFQSLYEGPFVDGVGMGLGVIKSIDGSVYRGMVNGTLKPNGHGLMLYPGGNTGYCGEWVNGKPNGDGVELWMPYGIIRGGTFRGGSISVDFKIREVLMPYRHYLLISPLK